MEWQVKQESIAIELRLTHLWVSSAYFFSYGPCGLCNPCTNPPVTPACIYDALSPGRQKPFILDLWNLAFFLYGKQGSEGGDPAEECMWGLPDQAR
jgi:hypothetical protein